MFIGNKELININSNYTVYMHISPSNKRYIGITCQNVNQRWRNGEGYLYNSHFYRAIKKYGWNNFQHIIITRRLTKEDAEWLEIELIRKWETTNQNKGYNITKGGEGTNGYKHTEEWKQERSKKMKGENHHMFGKHHTEETKNKISQAKQGVNNNNAKSVILLNTNEIFQTIVDGAKKYNIKSEGNISMCCENKYKNAGKLKDGTPLIWMWYDEYLQATEEEIQDRLMDLDTRVICVTTNEIFLTAIEGAKKYNTYNSSILQCCKGKRKSSGKHPITNESLVWKFYKDFLKTY